MPRRLPRGTRGAAAADRPGGAGAAAVPPPLPGGRAVLSGSRTRGRWTPLRERRFRVRPPRPESRQKSGSAHGARLLRRPQQTVEGRGERERLDRLGEMEVEARVLRLRALLG